MKHIQSIINSLFIIVILGFSSCNNDLEGTFRLSDEAQKYLIDTTIISFRMEDNYGISEEFYQSNIFYQTHHFFYPLEDAFLENFGISYSSSINRFYFMYVLRADTDHTSMEIEWNQKDMFTMNLNTKEITYGVVPKVSFCDTMTVRNTNYYNIIEIDYTDNINKIDKDTPVKTYISGNKGLIKFIRKDGVILERVE
ncbi:MAG: hypothetical protein LBQ22_02790 [Bacteroidales bacterium]|nr:hypothetical protein [Bacteroidales bacterium]